MDTLCRFTIILKLLGLDINESVSFLDIWSNSTAMLKFKSFKKFINNILKNKKFKIVFQNVLELTIIQFVGDYMEILFSMFVLFLGLILLNYGSDWFVLGSSRVARHLNISNFVIGATVVAFGTSLPEILTSVYASYINSSGIAIGNALGSCIANIGLILGLSVLISPIIVQHASVLKNGYIYLAFSIVAFVLGYNGFGFIDGIILFLMLLVYVVYTIKNGECYDNNETHDNNENNENDNNRSSSLFNSIIFTIVGLFAVIMGSDFFVNGARDIAYFLGISDKIIGFTLVAFGTSLPELMVSITAVRRKLGDMVLGNVIGSNIANIGCALALSSIINYIPPVKFEMNVNMFLVLLMVIFMSKGIIINKVNSIKEDAKNKSKNNKRNKSNDKSKSKLMQYSKITRIEGILLILIYIIFILKTTNIA